MPVNNARYQDRYGTNEDYMTAEAFTKYALVHDMNPSTLAVAWVMANPAVTAPIIGARNLGQLEDSLTAADFKMTEEMYAEISNLSKTPAAATDRTEVLTGKWK